MISATCYNKCGEKSTDETDYKYKERMKHFSWSKWNVYCSYVNVGEKLHIHATYNLNNREQNKN